MSRTVNVALDWTPNTNHGGLALAIQEGWFREAGLDVRLVSPHADNYEATPASRLEAGTAQFAIVPSESVISWHTWPGDAKPKIKAVATLLQGSAHAIVTLKSSGIDRPSLLDGKTYASYGARYEGRIVQEMIRKDGGKGEYVESTPPMLTIWDTFLKGGADATWIFLPWEGVLAKRAGVELNAFNPADYLDYGHSPVIAAHPDFLRDSPDVARAFLAAAARGYRHAAEHPADAAAALCAYVDAGVSAGEWPPLPTPLDPAMVADSAAAVAPHLLGPQGWGRMDLERWSNFLAFLDSAGLLTAKVQSRASGPDNATLDELRSPGGGGERVAPPPADNLATNEFLP
ncbi:sulfonate/nitrate/taurine transport system substrate-binding protein [Monoraphidium neglectum]|uniref:Thiamine pyrimidine synthase n=1 Tax=Monoraphidium neglectum TaxID=145388 RepID=A0A0D2MW24_9CHLO|nr:sulfonate/nitrate/taurine transport system substrate-binding protein [Monoraphidium neglectum]KIZ06750.1 sulfonate/nitrate/taurine transport system substrate-binding protein [Monoraphidium neglectum]|eukprot:XP_013905769.1 sulfonate/nitrate/taurine transport system substrate-binding protein [Monoraphidium neglectum]